MTAFTIKVNMGSVISKAVRDIDKFDAEKQKKIREQYNDLEMPAGEAQIDIEEAGIP